MPIRVRCPGCSARLNTPDAAAGKRVKCPRCQGAILVPVPEEDADLEEVEEAPPPRKAKPATVVKRAADEDEDEDDRPRRKSRARPDDEEAARPRRKKKPKKQGMPTGVLVGMILGGVLLVGGGAFAVYWFGIRQPDKPDQVAGPSGDNKPDPNKPPQPGGIPADWVAYQPPGGGFRVRLPAAAKSGNLVRMAKPEGYGNDKLLAAKLVGIDPGAAKGNALLIVRVLYFPPGLPAATRAEVADAAIRDLEQSQGWKNKVYNPIKWAGQDAKETRTETKALFGYGSTEPTEFTHVQRCLVTDSAAYIVEVQAEDKAEFEKLSRAFLDSFELTPANPPQP